jgi:beta-ribofuranosylaminobenzene 5'-phosphate synthase
VTHHTWVEAPGRLHFGVLDLLGDRGRRFGGVGAAVDDPHVLIEARRADALEVSGADCERARRFAQQTLKAYSIRGAAEIIVHQTLPPHSGLGSGTQLALSVARAVTDLYEIFPSPEELARVTGRGARSAIGTWLFSNGGFVLEGGRRMEGDAIAPLLARYSLPAEWRYVLVVPDGGPALSGPDESAALATLPAPAKSDVERVAHLVLMALLPSIVCNDILTFGQALSEIQQITGGWFASAQGGGSFARGPTAELTRLMPTWGAVGVGQSSWGPAVYGVTTGDGAARRVAAAAHSWSRSKGAVYWGPFRNGPARVWREFPADLP